MRVLAFLAVALSSSLALAGDRPLAGCSCDNECPLSQAVHGHRTFGHEAVATSARVRAETVKVVVQNLASI